VTEDEIEFIAAEMAKAGGTSWYPGRDKGPLVRVVSERYRDRARLVIAALDRYRASQQRGATPQQDIPVANNDSEPRLRGGSVGYSPEGSIRAGGLIVYRPPGDQRAYPCRVERIENGRAYLVPEIKSCTGWVDLDDLFAPVPKSVSTS
jgi:hypothetical protein